ncbi:hypothetical protein [Streptosporangium sandarakinum]
MPAGGVGEPDRLLGERLVFTRTRVRTGEYGRRIPAAHAGPA